MTAATMLIAFLELSAALRIVYRYSKTFDVEIFMERAPMDALIHMAFHMRTFLFMFQMSTILSVLRTQ